MWREAYVTILRLHPEAFRSRYADEMLWIFDQEADGRPPYRLLADGCLSLVRQWWRGPQSVGWQPAPAGSVPAFQRLDMRAFGGNPFSMGLAAAVLMLTLLFTVIVRHGYYPGMLHLPGIYEYVEVAPLDLTIDWRRLQALDLDGDGRISPSERMRPDARRWEPLFRVAEGDDGEVALGELRNLLLQGMY